MEMDIIKFLNQNPYYVDGDIVVYDEGGELTEIAMLRLLKPLNNREFYGTCYESYIGIRRRYRTDFNNPLGFTITTNNCDDYTRLATENEVDFFYRTIDRNIEEIENRKDMDEFTLKQIKKQISKWKSKVK